ncbi:redoxin domain-containing protein [Pedobacter hiemivivus]|uniref:Redoxin domain-containing protein n=1 Tax=Pedobacter hiemivivus TaxID=2530454 RepID=A0A4U1G3Y0_9SPHI|nr:redoxin domain-containing protein [Pedobacter hiemivivus]TCC97039.1 redoxin domain-containing protein [Pedobacter hiemivivus]TKC57539.1 redoxin domain-containing protein [Pedobacter hiemivivus]
MRQVFIALMITLSSLTLSAQTPTPGTAMPKAVFYKADGKTFTTDQITKGTKSLIILFDATCEHCQRVASNLSKRSKELTGANLYLVSQDEFRSINYFMDNFGKPLKAMKNVTVLQDRDHVFIPLFHPKQYPSLYLYGTDKNLDFYSSNENDVSKFFKKINN